MGPVAVERNEAERLDAELVILAHSGNEEQTTRMVDRSSTEDHLHKLSRRPANDACRISDRHFASKLRIDDGLEEPTFEHSAIDVEIHRLPRAIRFGTSRVVHVIERSESASEGTTRVVDHVARVVVVLAQDVASNATNGRLAIRLGMPE